MSQDLQLFNRAPQTQIEPWAMGGGANTALGPVMPQQNPLHKIHRSMRGRYVLAVILALVGAAAGGFAGYMTGEPGYMAKGAIRVIPTIPNFEKADTVMQMYDRYMTSESMRLMGDARVMKMATESKIWKAANPEPVADPVAAFAPGLKAEFLRSSEVIQVSYTHKDPLIAQAGVQAVIQTYAEKFAGQRGEDLDKKLSQWERIKSESNSRIIIAQREIDDLGKRFGTQDLSILDQSAWNEVANTKRLLTQAKTDLDNLQAPSGPTSEDMSVEDIAAVDPQMANHLQLKTDIEYKIETTRLGGAGPNSQQMKVLTDMLGIRNRLISERADWFRAKYKGFRFSPGGMDRAAANVPMSVDDMKAHVARLEKVQADQEREAKAISDVKQRIAQARDTINEERLREKEAREQIENLSFQRENLGKVEIVQDGGNLPPDTMDNRKKLALVGGVGGASIPLGLLLMIGLLDTRYRFSDEATSTEMQGVTLLGILPNLPDRLSDPEQAAIAAHCVHQIRTMLQINGGTAVDGTDRRVFAMTSASPGDGKTSLTLALGLSYAACGTRTLLIDCDLVGAGLSTRMNVSSAEGVLEAIANRSLLEYIRTTDIADVAILPVGSAHGYHASTLSPTALRRLIDEAKKHFDVILIDTGPILGSIEASLVCAAADGVVLAVSRGQNRPLVEKSLAHLNGIGARLAGVVFNRAQGNDFERSISGMSMRSAAAAGGSRNGPGNPVSAAGEAVGPVARAVAPYARKSDDGSDLG